MLYLLFIYLFISVKQPVGFGGLKFGNLFTDNSNIYFQQKVVKIAKNSALAKF
jgi:hypothetical protein